MAPQNINSSHFFDEDVEILEEDFNKERKSKKFFPKFFTFDYSQVVWRNVVLYSLLHILSIYGLLNLHKCHWKTLLFSVTLYVLSTIGITMGAHRLWAHRAFKATFIVRVILCILQSLAFQNDIYEWVRDHRSHHKFSETEADPHNANRGLFFAHIGWLLSRKHPEVIRKGKTIDISDMMKDPVVVTQRKFYPIFVVLFCFVIPIIIPCYFWSEDWMVSVLVPGMLRYCVSLHATWLVNSLAHWIGYKPYDKNISPTENTMVSLFTLGEGWHNFHHVFPQDYRSAELAGLLNLNITTNLIDLCNKIGLLWDCKTVSEGVIRARKTRTGSTVS